MEWLIMRTIHQATPTTILRTKKINFRLAVICLAAACAGLPIAIIRIAKLPRFISAVASLPFAKGLTEGCAPLTKTVTLLAMLVLPALGFNKPHGQGAGQPLPGRAT